MTLKCWLIVLSVALAAGGIGGAALGYRYASGRCAAEMLEAAQQAQKDAQTAIDEALERQQKENDAAIKAVKAEAVMLARQIQEKTRYAQVIKEVPVAVDCRVPDAAYRMLINAVRAANASAADTH